jgi:hypothetical protein
MLLCIMYMLCVYYYLAILENARKMEILVNCLFNSGYFFFHPEVPRTVLLYILTIINGVCNVMVYVMLWYMQCYGICNVMVYVMLWYM